jgi:ketosteroid isomerase-like protein
MPVVSNYRYVVRKIAPIISIVALTFGRIAFGAPESDATIIEQNYKAWVQVTNARDLELWSSYLAPDASFMPPDAPLLDTRDAILDYYQKASGTSRWFKVWLKQADGSWKCRVNTWDYTNAQFE